MKVVLLKNLKSVPSDKGERKKQLTKISDFTYSQLKSMKFEEHTARKRLQTIYPVPHWVQNFTNTWGIFQPTINSWYTFPKMKSNYAN